MSRRNAIPRNQYEAQDRERALATLARMRRERLTLSAAAKTEGIDPRTVLRYVGSALYRRGRDQDYRATGYDRNPRTLHFITTQGIVPVTVHDSRTASVIAAYMNAVRTFIYRGDSSAVEGFKGESFQASGVTYEFVTDTDTLARLADAGVLAMEGLYHAVQGAKL